MMKRNGKRHIVELDLERQSLGYYEAMKIYGRLWEHYLRCFAPQKTHKQVCYEVLWRLLEQKPLQKDLIDDAIHLIDGLPSSGKVDGFGRIILYVTPRLN